MNSRSKLIVQLALKHQEKASSYSNVKCKTITRSKLLVQLALQQQDKEISFLGDKDSESSSNTLLEQQTGTFSISKVNDTHITFRKRRRTVEYKVRTEDSFIKGLVPDIVISPESSELSLEKCSNSTNESVNNTTDCLKQLPQELTPKSALKSNKNGVVKRVTFNKTSSIISGSPRKSYGTPTPTIFFKDSGKGSDGKSQFIKRSGIARTPFYSNATLNSTYSVSPPQKTMFGTPKRLLHQSSNVLEKASKVKKMPNFAKLHKKIFDNMLDIQEHTSQNEKRAKLLLSGRKPSSGTLSSSKRSTPKSLNGMPESYIKLLQNSNDASLKHRRTDTPVSKPKLKAANNHVQFNSGRLLRQKGSDALVSDLKMKIVNGLSRFGLKSQANSITKQEAMAVASSKLRPLKNTSENRRIEIKGVRSNRRFELLMKSRFV